VNYLAECGRLTIEQPRCEACGRRLQCVYTVDDGGWTFLLGRRCFAQLTAFLAELREIVGP